MSRKRKKKVDRPRYLSVGPLPPRLAAGFEGRSLVFSDASQRRQGGLAAVLFVEATAEPVILVRSVPLAGSNELELQAALFAIGQASTHFPGRRFVLFSDNQDAVIRLQRAVAEGLAQDPELAGLGAPSGLEASIARVEVHWIRGHGTCRGNALADQHAALAAS